MRKTFFYIHTNIVNKKWWEQNARNNFCINTLLGGQKMLGKKSSEKSAKNVFLYSHEYRELKMGRKYARNDFSRNTRIVRAKNVGKKIVGKKCEKPFFLYSHEYRDQKIWGKKTRETILPETHE